MIITLLVESVSTPLGFGTLAKWAKMERRKIDVQVQLLYYFFKSNNKSQSFGNPSCYICRSIIAGWLNVCVKKRSWRSRTSQRFVLNTLVFYKHTHAQTHVYVYVHVHTYICIIYIYTYITYTYTYIYRYIHVCVKNAQIHAHTWKDKKAHRNAHILTHTHLHALSYTHMVCIVFWRHPVREFLRWKQISLKF